MQPFRPALRTGALALAVAAVVALSGCSAAGEFVQDRAKEAGCAVAGSVIDRVAGELTTAVAQAPVDPAAALPVLKSARAALAGLDAAADEGVLGTDVSAVVATLDELIPLVESAAAGRGGDTAEIQKLADRLSDQVTTLAGVC